MIQKLYENDFILLYYNYIYIIVLEYYYNIICKYIIHYNKDCNKIDSVFKFFH